MTVFAIPFVHGLQRHRMTRSGHTYDTDRNKADKQEVATRYIAAGGRLHAKGVPVAVKVSAHIPLPSSAPQKVDSQPCVVKPDLDNILKLILDGLNGVAFVDDAQVVFAVVQKCDRRRMPERVVISVEEV